MMPSTSNGPTPPSSTSSNGASPDGQQFRVVRKRNRIPLSCAPCRHRKLRCNRGHPCDNCTKRGDTAACSYAMPGVRRKGTASVGNASPDDMQNRIDRLEGLVLSLMTSNGATAPAAAAAAAQAALASSRSNSLSTGSDLRLDPEGADMIREEPETLRREDDSEVEQVSKQIGIMKVDNGRTVFASDAHWYAILGEISEVKQYFAAHKEDYRLQMERVQATKANESPGTAFLLQSPPAKDKAELLAAFPSKADADRLIARYFNAYDPSVHIIHGPSFQKQYDRHWHSPHETPVVWLALCFAMMTLALQSYHRAGDEPPQYRGKAMTISHDFRKLTAQCLLLADITQPIAQVLETLVLHVQAEYGRSRDAEPGVLLMASLCVRLAMRMGYHRDPAPHPQISPFTGEMRRRVWNYVRSLDVHISFQFGLPQIIRLDHCDTAMPRNLYDDELHEDMKTLPPSRPLFEATPMSYGIAKGNMIGIFGRIVDRSQSVADPPSYDEVMKFDQDLREIRATHPPLLQMRSFQESARDPANLIMQRLGLELVYLRSLFVLHRRFVARGRENPRYAYSRRTCIDASMQLLGHQATLHRESQPGGRLRSVKWYISSMTTHDFLLAAMLLCLDLFHTSEMERKGLKTPSQPGSPRSTDLYAEDRREEMLNAVEHCIVIWESLREGSMEAYKASMILRVMVEKLKEHQRMMQSYASQQQEQQQQQQQQPSFIQPYAPPQARAGISPPQPGMKRGHHFGVFPSEQAGDMNTDDLPPEQSAAMTLCMLSSGGMSPNSAFTQNLALGQQPQASQANGADKSPQSGYPASMAALLNEPLPPQPPRTGLTPQYTGPETTSSSSSAGMMTGLSPGPASPFSQMLANTVNINGSAPGFLGMDGMGVGDIDWGAWDNYIQGTTSNSMMDGSGMQMWPMTDPMLDSMGAPPPPQQAQPQQSGLLGQQNGASPVSSNGGGGGGGGGIGGVFMGAGTPGMMQ